MKLTPQKLEGWGYHNGENFIILTLTVYDPNLSQTDRQTDRRTGDIIQRAKHICYMLSRAKN